jgi:hypothetical protein
VTSDASYEAAGVEDAVGVELLLDRAHEFDGGRWIAPGVDGVWEQAAAKEDGAATVRAKAGAEIFSEYGEMLWGGGEGDGENAGGLGDTAGACVRL